MTENEERLLEYLKEAHREAGSPIVWGVSANQIAKDFVFLKTKVIKTKRVEETKTSRQMIAYMLKKLTNDGLVEYNGEDRHNPKIIIN